ncbi:hypothetical protein [Cohnella abietis]|uniref:Uncharacterized protein n=1 Tax=Cohnella abietis TaxID=2507935 RepID=A0A3T1D2J2_9BACL|nr:hypothetical protein [Cohnella abietis]BBI32261.1 hypothetical protein KCTCHS21_16600 [Cohnella abietis]
MKRVAYVLSQLVHFDDAAKCIEKVAEIYITRLGNLREAYMCYALAKDYYGDAGCWAFISKGNEYKAKFQ